MNVFYVPGPTDPTARLAALGASLYDPSIPMPNQAVVKPCVVLYSRALHAWAVYPDDGTLTPAAWANDPLVAADLAAATVAAALVSFQQIVPRLPAALAQAQIDAANYPSAAPADQAAIIVRLINNTVLLATACNHAFTHLGLTG